MLTLNLSPELHCLFGSLAHVQQYQIEKIRHPEQPRFGNAFGCVHVNAATSQHAGTHLLHCLVVIDDEHVFGAHFEGNAIAGAQNTSRFLEAGVSESSVTFEKRASPERSKPRLLSLSKRGRGSPAPAKRESLRACLRLLRGQRSFARSCWPHQSFVPQVYPRPLSPGPSPLLDSLRGDRLPRLHSCPKD